MQFLLDRSFEGKPATQEASGYPAHHPAKSRLDVLGSWQDREAGSWVVRGAGSFGEIVVVEVQNVLHKQVIRPK